MKSDTPWRLDPSIVYLNHGSFGACPQPVRDAQAAWRDRLEADAVRFMDLELPARLASARETLGRFLRADPEGFGFLPNATTGVATALASLELRPGDELLTTDHEYNATINALREAGRRAGATVVVARVPFPASDPSVVVDAVLDAVTPRTRYALVSHVTSPTAVIFPIERIVRELADRGIETIVDAAHAPGMVPVDVDALRPAFWTANGHKWLCAPKGSAVLWVRGDLRPTVRPLVISHGANDPRVAAGERTRFRLEFDWPGTVDPTPYLTMADAVDLVAAATPGGWPTITAANHALALEARDVLCATLGIEPPVPDAMLGAMAAVPLPVRPSDEAAAAITQRLREVHGIVVPVNAWPVRAARVDGAPAEAVLLRVSAQRYNELADYERLAAALPSALAAVRAIAE